MGVFDGLAVVEEGGSCLAFFTIEFGDAVRALEVTRSELCDLGFGITSTLTVWITDEDIIEGTTGAVEICAVLVSFFCGIEKDLADAVLSFGGVLGIGIVASQFTISGDGASRIGFAGATGLINFSDGELRFVGRGGTGRIVTNAGEHADGTFDVDAGFDADERVGNVALGGLVSDGLLAFNRLSIVRAGGIFADDNIVCIEGFEELALAFENGGMAVGGGFRDWAERVFRVDCTEVLGGAVVLTGFFSGDGAVIELDRGLFARTGLTRELVCTRIFPTRGKKNSGCEKADRSFVRGHGGESNASD